MELIVFTVLLGTAPAATVLPTGSVHVQQTLHTSSNADTKLLRHCQSIGFVTSAGRGRGPPSDYLWQIQQPALNNAPGAVSFYNPATDTYLIPVAGQEPGRLGLNISGAAEPDEASFALESPARDGNASRYSFRSLSKGAFAGAYLTLTASGSPRGNCVARNHYRDGDGDAALVHASQDTAGAASFASWDLVPPPTPVCALRVDSPAAATHRVPPLAQGCHLDAGYAHEPRGISSELVYGPAFAPAPDVPGANAAGTPLNDSAWRAVYAKGPLDVALDADDPAPLVNGSRSLRLAAAGALAVNAGLGHEGLFLEAAKPYEGFVLCKGGGAPATLRVSLFAGDGNSTVLAEADVVCPSANGSFAKRDFVLTPNASTACVGISQAEADATGVSCPVGNSYKGASSINGAAHVCVQCGGRLGLALVPGSAAVRVGYVSLQPGAWGRYKGLPIRGDTARALQGMGIQFMRQGGSFLDAGSSNGAWWMWRGPVWQRPSAANGAWRHSDMAPYGLFEFIDLCSAMGVEPVVSTFAEIPPSRYADLVEYCWGNDTTPMGRLRAADGHPEPFAARYFELGNEQTNSDFVAQATAMEAKAAALGMPKTLHYIYPSNRPGANFPSDDTGYAMAKLGLGTNVKFDIHCNDLSDPDCIAFAYDHLNRDAFKTWGSIILETNLATHDVERMLTEARAVNMLLSEANAAGRLQGRAASFCLERSGWNEGGLNDQGLLFYLPNASWYQPPGHVHAMTMSTWLPMAVNITATNTGAGNSCGIVGVDISAQASEDGTKVVVRILNTASDAVEYVIDVGGGFDASATVEAQSISHPDLKATNTPSCPDAIVPSRVRSLGGLPAAISVPSNSVTIVVVTQT